MYRLWLLSVLLISFSACRGDIGDAERWRPGTPPEVPPETPPDPTDSGTTRPVDATPPTDPTTQPPDPRPGMDAGMVPPMVDAGPAPDAGPPDPTGMGADAVWTPLSVFTVVNPMDHGAVGDGMADDLGALRATIDALPPAGGIVAFPAGRVFRKTNVLLITKAHVKLWGNNRAAEIYGTVGNTRRRQSVLFRAAGGGVFGLKFRSDATARFDALEDHMIVADRGTLIEIVGSEVQGSSATAIFLNGSTEHYIEGNYLHHTYADHIHHTAGATASWVWNNFIFNEAPSRGDDGVACVTYGTNSKRCSDMEWWKNTIQGTAWGRGYSVIGGDDIHIHNNSAVGVAGAGIIVASESSFNTSASQGITIERNYVEKCGHTIRHPGILVSGLSNAAGPLRDITLSSNASMGTPAGAYRAEGQYENVTNTGLVSQKAQVASAAIALPRAKVEFADTSILRTRDLAPLPQNTRSGAYRIHVRRAPSGTGYQQRFEYVVQGPSDAVDAFTKARTAAKDFVSETRNVDGTSYALILTSAPITIPDGLSGVTFRALREGDQNGKLSWLWDRLDSGKY